MNRKDLIISVIVLSTAVFATLAWFGFRIADSAAQVNTFEECVAVGNPVIEVIPRRCTSGNKLFTEALPSKDDVMPIDQTDPGALFNDAISLTIGDHVRFGDGLIVERLAIDDSRCPVDVQCVWAGELAARLEIGDGKAGSGSAEIRLGEQRNPMATASGYRFELVRITETTAVIRVQVGVSALSLESKVKIY